MIKIITIVKQDAGVMTVEVIAEGHQEATPDELVHGRPYFQNAMDFAESHQQELIKSGTITGIVVVAKAGETYEKLKAESAEKIKNQDRNQGN